MQSNVINVTRPAAGDLSAKQYHAVMVDGNGRVAAATVLGQIVYGILQNDPAAADRGATVAVYGRSEAIAGGVIDEGDVVACDTNGRFVVATKARTNTSDAGAAADALLGGYVVGIALEPAAANGDRFSLLITHSGAVPTTPA